MLRGWEREVKRGRPVRSGREELGEEATDALLQSWGKTGGLDLEEWRTRRRSAGYLPAALTAVVCGFPGSA